METPIKLMRWLMIVTSLACWPSFQARAEYAVGYFYLRNGQPEKAYREFRELAELGFSFYMNMIADMHLKGVGVPADPVLAHVWYSLSAAQDNEIGLGMKIAIEQGLATGQLQRSITLTREYAELYLEPYVAGWSLKPIAEDTNKKGAH